MRAEYRECQIGCQSLSGRSFFISQCLYGHEMPLLRQAQGMNAASAPLLANDKMRRCGRGWTKRRAGGSNMRFLAVGMPREMPFPKTENAARWCPSAATMQRLNWRCPVTPQSDACGFVGR